MKKITTAFLCLVITGAAGVGLRAGGRLESFDITGLRPSPTAGQYLARVIGIQWDTRSIPVRYVVNTASGVPDANGVLMVPNPLGPPVLTMADATTALQSSFNAWNNIPTSYIDMRIAGTRTNTGLVGFDMVNELSFNTAASFGAIASSPSVNLIQDSTFVAGDDIDGDGDPDVSAAIKVMADADGDGDLEFPPGFYKAGTILDNDVQFNTKVSNGLRFTVGDAALDTVARSVDLNTTATHEFGHSHGLSHSMDNQSSATDGDGATMFPFIDTSDPVAEALQRTLHTDDIAWSSYIYPEGTAKSGPAALTGGDIAFSKLFGLITGQVRHGVLDQALAGGSVYAIEQRGDRLIASGYSGTVDLSFNPLNGGLFYLPPEFGLVDGRYVIPVPRGNYAVGIEAVDGTPAAAGNISFTCQVGAFYGQQNFNEEFYSVFDDDSEARPGRSRNVRVAEGRTTGGINIVTNRAFNISNFGALNAIGFVNSPPGRYYAVQIPAAQISDFMPDERIVVHSALFETHVVDASTVPIFSEVMLTTGTINPDGSAAINLTDPLDSDEMFVGQETDFSPFFVRRPRSLALKIRRGIATGEIQNLFLVLRIPTTAPYPGVSGQPPLIGLSTAAPLLGQSFVSSDGGATFVKVTTANFRFSLVLAELPTPWWWWWW
jgi:hypothetical protein